MIDVKGLKKNYGGLQVLKGVDLTINKGDCVVLVGPSGCGKSTFLRCLNRLEEPDGGHVIFNGKEVTDHDIDHVRQKMGMVFQHFNLFPHLTVKKNITLAPVRLGLTTLATKYVSLNSKYTGEASILAIIMMIFGVAIMFLNQMSLRSRKNYTTVTGKSGQTSKINLGRAGKHIIAAVLIVITFFTSIFPIVSFAFETFLPNPGDYSFLYTGDADNLTVKWWTTDENITENGMYGQKGILHNETIWHAFRGTILVSVCCSLLAGTIGTMIGYAVSKTRRSRWANYVNAVAFLPYLMPSIAVGVAFFVLFSNRYVNLFNTYTLLIIVGTIKYIPFASRASLNSMLQLSGEIEEAAIIQDIPWSKRMTRIIIPIQKSSIISGYLLPFMTCLRELSLFMLLCVQGFILSTTLDYFDEMGLYAFSSGINLILIVTILICNTLVNKVTGASLDKGIGG